MTIFHNQNIYFIACGSSPKIELRSYSPRSQNLLTTAAFQTAATPTGPHCIVQDVVEQGKISTLRFDSYLKLLKEIVARSRNVGRTRGSVFYGQVLRDCYDSKKALLHNSH